MVRVVSVANLGCSVPLDSFDDDISIVDGGCVSGSSFYLTSDEKEERRKRNLESLINSVSQPKPVRIGRTKS